MSGTNARLVLIGWHGADWRSIHPLVDAGLMPNLRALVERGVAGNLKPVGPPVPALLWTSMATGKTADQHGVLSAVEPDPLSGRVRPAGNASRRVKALWNIAMQSGLATHVVGWLGAHPAEKLNGSSVTSDFFQPLARCGGAWPVARGSIWPQTMAGELANLRMHVGELTAKDLLPFIPRLSEIDQEADRRVIAFADTLAQTISTHAVTTWLLERAPWNLVMIGWNGLQRVCQQFMRYAAPLLPGIDADDCARYGEVVRGMYCFYDMLLGRIMQLAGPEATIAIVSAAGFRSGDERPASNTLQNLPVAWYRPHGICALGGPGIVGDELIHGATLLDVMPTMLNVLGLPAADDMPGRVIKEAFVRQPDESRIPSWEDVPGDCGMEPRQASDEHVSQAINELEGLGYKNPSTNRGLFQVERERSLNTAFVHLSHKRYSEARAALLKLEPDEQLNLLLAYCHLRCNDFAACEAALRGAPKEGLLGAHAKILASYLAEARGRSSEAVSAAASAERVGFKIQVVNWIVGSIYARHGQLARAEEALRNAIELDASFEPAHQLLAQVLNARGKNGEAAEVALQGLSIDYASASLHSALGVALAQRGDRDGALKAFANANLFQPQVREARDVSA